MSALRWLWRTDGAVMGLSAAVWFANALWDRDWWMAFAWTWFVLWFAVHVLRPPRGGTYDLWLPDGSARLATVTTDRDGKPTRVDLFEKPVR